MEKTEHLLDRLQQLDGPHAAYGIFKICIGTRITFYSLRTVKPSPSVTKVLLHFDNAQRDCLEIFNQWKPYVQQLETSKLDHQVGWVGFKMLK